jgi:hypothetical protein
VDEWKRKCFKGGVRDSVVCDRKRRDENQRRARGILHFIC